MIRWIISFEIELIEQTILEFQAKEELQKARHDFLQCAQTPKVSLAAQAILRKVENERDAGEFDLTIKNIVERYISFS